jgi:hypothetical protein
MVPTENAAVVDLLLNAGAISRFSVSSVQLAGR